jgi:uncharacterized metal-binding protein
MASGKNHDRITLVCLPLLAGMSLATTKNTDLTFWLASSFLFSGFMFGPDLDIHSQQYLRWGWLRWLWKPYQRSIRHRSPLSHGPMIGTALRLVYVGLWWGLIVFLYLGIRRSTGQPTGSDRQLLIFYQGFFLNHQPQLLAAIIGLELGAMSHYLADIFSSTIKQWGKRSTAQARQKKKSESKAPGL